MKVLIVYLIISILAFAVNEVGIYAAITKRWARTNSCVIRCVKYILPVFHLLVLIVGSVLIWTVVTNDRNLFQACFSRENGSLKEKTDSIEEALDKHFCGGE